MSICTLILANVDMVTYKVSLRESSVQLVISHFMDLGFLLRFCIFSIVGMVIYWIRIRFLKFGHGNEIQLKNILSLSVFQFKGLIRANFFHDGLNSY